VADAGEGENAANSDSKNSENANASGSSSSDGLSSSDAEIAPPPSSPPGVRTQLQKGIRHLKQYTDGTIRYGMLSSTGEPLNLTEAMSDSK
jgi:hypothetical protein